MKKRLAVVLLASLLAAMLSACGGSQEDGAENRGTGNPTEIAPPEQYQGMSNPFAESDAQAVAAGETLYQVNCASCHGERGQGDGPAASALNPKPSNLVERSDEMSDGYTFWRISEGGTMPPFNSSMPPWSGILNEEEIWQLVTYIHSLGS